MLAPGPFRCNVQNELILPLQLHFLLNFSEKSISGFGNIIQDCNCETELAIIEQTVISR
jgi:hypothetical protein